MTYYYWGPAAQSQFSQPYGQQQFSQPYGQQQFPTFTPTQRTAPPASIPSSGVPMFPAGGTMTAAGPGLGREESYIENILRLNRGKPATFSFTVPEAVGLNGQGNTKKIRGVVEEAGRDHAIIRELSTNHRFLFPMVYFDYAEFDEELTYLNSVPIP